MELLAFIAGLLAYFLFTLVPTAFYTVKPDERATLTSFGRADVLLGGAEVGATEGIGSGHDEDVEDRYAYPAIRVKGPGGPYFKWPWQRVHKVSVATNSLDIAWDPTRPEQEVIEAVTKDNLTTGVNGQIRFRVSERNLYAYFFGVSSPLEHVMGYFISVLRERIATFTAPQGGGLISSDEMPASEAAVELAEGVSINDLRKNLPLLNQYMEEQCRVAVHRYGIELDAALITTIDPPAEVDHALSAINSTRNQVAADISTARADAEQQITMSERAVEIASNNAQAEVAPLRELANTLHDIKAAGGSEALTVYLRNMRTPLFERARHIVRIGS